MINILSINDIQLIDQYRKNVEVTKDAEDAQELCVRLHDMMCDNLNLEYGDICDIRRYPEGETKRITKDKLEEAVNCGMFEKRMEDVYMYIKV